MLNNVKALIVISFLGAVLFVVAKPVALRFMTEEVFRIRRNTWFALSAAAFVSPNLLVYSLLAAPVLIWAARRDSNVAALLVFAGGAAPSGSIPIPKLITVGTGTVTLLVVILPALLRRPPRGTPQPMPWWLPRFCLFLILVYCMLLAIPYLEYESVTNVMRREINILLGAPISYMFFSRVLRSHYQVKEVVAAYVLGSAAIALIALAESGLGWLFYVELTRHWGLTEGVSYAIRAGRLRAVVSTGHFLSLGFSLALAFGCWLYLKRSVPSRLTVIMVGLLMWAGMMASYARGAWIAAILMLFLYYWLQPGGLGKVFKAFAACVVAGMVALATPWGDQLTSSLPFLGGTVDNFNIEYRQRLFQRALELIPDHPWFGDTRVIQRMQDMRQGEGIVDLVNSYLNIALQYGLVALGSILLVYVLVLVQTWKTSRALRTKDDDAAALGTVLITGILGGLFFAWGGPFPGQTLMFAAVATAYVRICREQRAAEIKARVPKRRQPAPILPHG